MTQKKLDNQRVTMRTIAENAGVAQSTVSYVLSGRKRGGRISEDVARKIRKTAKALGYMYNPAARALILGKSFTVGLITSFENLLHSVAWPLCIAGIEERLLKAGYHILVRNAEKSAVKLAQTMIRQNVIDATILLDTPKPKALRYAIDLLPPVSINLMQEGLKPCVVQDCAPGLHEAVRRLHALGHRRILWVDPNEMKNGALTSQRFAWVLEQAQALGMPVDIAGLGINHLHFFDSHVSDNRHIIAKLAPHLPHPLKATAIMCWNDRMAFMVLDVLRDRGYQTPRDLTLVGFDNFIAPWTIPALSTVSAEFTDMGRAAADLVLRMLDGTLSYKEARKTVVRVPTRFVERDTTAALPR